MKERRDLNPPKCSGLLMVLMLTQALASGKTEARGTKARIYEVKDLTGTVWTRKSHQAHWRKSWEGQRLIEDQLIQVTEGAAVTLREVVSKDDQEPQGERFHLRITQMLVTRVNPEMLRKVKISTHFVENKDGLFTKDQKLEDVKFDLSDAWQRLTGAVTGRTPQASKGVASLLSKDGLVFGSEAKKLSMLSPVNNGVLESREWPIDFKLVWNHPGKQKLKYAVYFWPAGSPRGAPIATTEQDFYTVQVAHAGAFLSQVTSEDGSWQSSANVVHALIPADPLPANGATVSNVATIETLRPSYPPDLTTLVYGGENTGVDFVWDAENLDPAEVVVLKIFDGSGSLTHEERSRSSLMNVKLPPGRYNWHLSTGSGGSGSLQRSLTILEQKSLGDLSGKRDLFKKMLDEKGHSTLILTDGL